MIASIRKALVPLVLAAWAVGQSWIETRHFNASQELVMAALGVVGAVVVYIAPNTLSSSFTVVRKAIVMLATTGAAVIVQWLVTGHFSLTQEVITAIEGVGSAVFVYWVPNLLAPPTPPPVGPVA